MGKRGYRPARRRALRELRRDPLWAGACWLVYWLSALTLMAAGLEVAALFAGIAGVLCGWWYITTVRRYQRIRDEMED